MQRLAQAHSILACGTARRTGIQHGAQQEVHRHCDLQHAALSEERGHAACSSQAIHMSM